MSSQSGQRRRLSFAPIAAVGMLVVFGVIVLAAVAASRATDEATRYLRRAEYVSDCSNAPSVQVTPAECARLAKDPPKWPDHVEIRDRAILLSYGQAQQATANAIYPVVGLLVAGLSAICALIAIGRRDPPRVAAKDLADAR